MMVLRSYPKVWNIGHPNTDELFDGEVVVQEKVDGSQFSFGVVDGELDIRSKGATIYHPCADKLFSAAVDTVAALFEQNLLHEGWTYRGEAIRGPKHNTLAYDRAPAGCVILYDIDIGEERRVDTQSLRQFAYILGLEVVPTLYQGVVEDVEQLKKLLDLPPLLGGEMIEGIVVKNYHRFDHTGKQVMGKYVAEKFHERHTPEWKSSHPKKAEIVQQLGQALATEARWVKAVQRRRDNGDLLWAPQDIGPLLIDLQRDTEEEEKANIMEALYEAFSKDILRYTVQGFPQWYKEQLLQEAFKS